MYNCFLTCTSTFLEHVHVVADITALKPVKEKTPKDKKRMGYIKAVNKLGTLLRNVFLDPFMEISNRSAGTLLRNVFLIFFRGIVYSLKPVFGLKVSRTVRTRRVFHFCFILKTVLLWRKISTKNLSQMI